MAHNIWKDSDGLAHMFCVGAGAEAAWHMLGQRTPDAVTWEKAMELAGLNWRVVLMPLATRKPSAADQRDRNGRLLRGAGEVITVPGNFAVMRDMDGAFLGVVGDQYTVIQNRDAFGFVDSLLAAEAGAHYESAGALGNGERIWCLARVPGADFNVLGQESASDIPPLYYRA